MIANQAIPSTQIKQAAETLKKLRPIYADILSFHERIFIAQETSKLNLHLDPIQLPTDVISIKNQEKLPLINPSDFVIDIEAGQSLFKEICHIAQKTNRELAITAGILLDSFGNTINPKELFSSLLEGHDSFFDKTAAELTIDKNPLAFITYSSINPSLTLGAEQLSTYLEDDVPWEKGYCPICGNLPGLSLFGNDGQRLLNCSFCWHKWIGKRVQCPFCENTDAKNLHYFCSDEEKEYRVDICDNCKKYIKTVDDRLANRAIYPPLEQVATLHLDIKAQEMGFKSGIPLELPV
ncbi:MAG: formate dehydrogenase accessory protein FdhE [Deltaproteobacteria bacterium]|nr:MAG: formate dehydrogenase accessory protein FdhE [Deltaproteobacteria bacterium]